MGEITREEIKAQFGEQEAKADKKLADAMHASEKRFDAIDAALKEINKGLVESRADNKSTRTVVVTTTIGTALALFAAILAALSWGSAQWYNGTVLRDLVHQEIQDKK